MLKIISKKILMGIGMGSAIFNGMLLFAKLAGFDTFFNLVSGDYVRQSLCALFVAIIFNLLAIVYSSDRIGYGFQVLTHMGGGLFVYFIVAYYAGWLPLAQGVGILISAIFLMISVSFLIWLGFYLYYKHEARQMNKKISHIE